MNMVLSDHTADTFDGTVTMYYFNGTTDGGVGSSNTSATVNNLKLGGTTSTTNCYTDANPSTTTSSSIFKQVFNFSSSTTAEIFKFANFYNEMIEIPEDYGITFSFTTAGTSLELDYSLNVKFVEF